MKSNVLNLRLAPAALKRDILIKLNEGKLTTGEAVRILRRAINTRIAREQAALRPHHSSGYHNECIGGSLNLRTPYFG